MRKKQDLNISEKELKEILFELRVIKGWSYKKIATHFGVKEWKVINWAKKLGVNKLSTKII